MSVYSNLVSKSKDDHAGLVAILKDFTLVHPTVGELLAGIPPTATQPAVPPGKVTFWVELGGMKASISPREGEVCIFANIQDPCTPWLCLEAALLAGNIDVRKRTVRTPSY